MAWLHDHSQNVRDLKPCVYFGFAGIWPKNTVNAIFGIELGVESEHFSLLNRLTIFDLAEIEFDQGFLVIVPDVEEGASAAKVQGWHACSEKGYQIRDEDGDNMVIGTPPCHNL